jgi:hypothetical protein
MAAVEQQHSEIHALVMAALQTGRESPDISLQIDEVLASIPDDSFSDDFIPLPSNQSKK